MKGSLVSSLETRQPSDEHVRMHPTKCAATDNLLFAAEDN